MKQQAGTYARIEDIPGVEKITWNWVEVFEQELRDLSLEKLEERRTAYDGWNPKALTKKLALQKQMVHDEVARRQEVAERMVQQAGLTA